MPGILEVKAKKNDAEGNLAGEAVVQYDFGEDLKEMVELFGENVTFTNSRSQMKIGLQAYMRRCIEAGKGQEEIAVLVEQYKPGVQMDRVVDPVAAAKSHFASLDEDGKRAFLEQLRAAE
jgi:hypothetical protein